MFDNATIKDLNEQIDLHKHTNEDSFENLIIDSALDSKSAQTDLSNDNSSALKYNSKLECTILVQIDMSKNDINMPEHNCNQTKDQSSSVDSSNNRLDVSSIASLEKKILNEMRKKEIQKNFFYSIEIKSFSLQDSCRIGDYFDMND